jgi:hypothetical protein
LDSFPEWALPIKAKYINVDKAREEACEVTLQVIADKVDHENKRG